MDCCVTDGADVSRVFEVLAPDTQRLPVVLASPHSGRHYPLQFLAETRLDPLTLRKSEDSYVDEIFERCPLLGVPLLKALFPRAFLDTNREAFELDPDMFDDALPAYVNTRSPRVIAGLGTIARVVAHGQEIYRNKLNFDEALSRVNRLYHPYHAALRGLVDNTVRRFGYCLLIDCHSMPSTGGLADLATSGSLRANASVKRVDFVLGDCYGNSCAPVVIDTAERWLAGQGYVVTRNAPYAGGYTTRHYGRPRIGMHALQIEINRALYMDEARMTRKPFLAALAEQMAGLVTMLGQIDTADLRPL
jgi:N-formylglutamate amidohydrolase